MSFVFSFGIFVTKTYASTAKLLGVSNLNCPYVCEKNRNYNGFFIDVISRSLAYSAIEFDYTITDWGNAIKISKSRNADILIGTQKTKDQWLTFAPVKIVSSKFGLYVSNDKDLGNSGHLISLNNTLGLSRKYSFNSSIKKHVFDNFAKSPKNFVFFNAKNTTEKAIEAILKRDVDVIVEDVNIMRFEMEKDSDLASKISEYKILEDEILELYVAFANKGDESKVHLDAFLKGFNILKSGGGNSELTKLKQKYNIKD